ncbi:uncharacterized protein LOC126888179 [Diabrotica virgifera virgifera]|uniref:SOCS box domain-containing protein n=1 Tax=Diabrotica virgifera virgifera TaxID=50390 RepID=A0ABM5KPL5_DIAVI|nr:uncharacterized protein LOC126888179 [Diabrotica virgifera virgifera]
MESFLRCYLDCFNELPRNSLHDRRKRQHVVDYISTLIEGCSRVEKNSDESAIEAVKTILKYHQENKDDNGKVCMMGRYHNILYVAVKLCFDWQIKDAATVTMLLDEIYKCEKTFERILIGAIFGNKAPHYIAGWKSDFDSEEENIRAVVYFLDKANRAQLNISLDFSSKDESFRFIDLPIESCGKASPLKICLQLGLPDKLLIFLRFGAKVYTQNEDVTLFEHILNRLLEFNHVYPYNLVACLQLLLRTVTRIKIDIPVEMSQESYQLLLEKMYERYFDLIQDGLIPPERCGISPPQLKHICRCVIRDRLWENYQLPDGIRSLPVPEKLWRYLDLLED